MHWALPSNSRPIHSISSSASSQGKSLISPYRPSWAYRDISRFRAPSTEHRAPSTEHRAGYLLQILKRLNRLLPPYLLWTALYLLVKADNPAASASHFASVFLLGTGIGVGYYVVVLTQFVCLAPLIQKIQSKRAHLFVLMTISAVGLAFSYVTRLGYPSSPLSSFPANAIPFFVWYPFFHLGIYIRLFPTDAEAIKPLIPKAILLALALSILEAEWLLKWSTGAAVSQIKISSYLLSIFVLLYIATRTQTAGTSASRLFSFAGRNSYVIYLSHLLFLGQATKLLNRQPLLHDNQLFTAPLVSVVVLCLCLAAVKILRRCVPVNLYRFVGF
jgi:fucose 4-O-acetylase-like acetyltransferase